MDSKKTIIFDFDGTIADTLSKYISILSRIDPSLKKELDTYGIKVLQDMGVRELMKKLNLSVFRVLYLLWRGSRILKSEADQITVFPEMPDIVNKLVDGGHNVLVLSFNNKEVINNLFTRKAIKVPKNNIWTTNRLFSKAERLSSMIQVLSLDKQKTVFVGDELRDVEACIKTGIPMVAVSWGFNSPASLVNAGANFLAKEPHNILDIIQSF